MAAKKETSPRKILFNFDFDHSLIDNNCDTWITNMAPQLNLEANYREIRKRFPKWTDFMNHITKLLHENGYRKEDYIHCLGQLEIIPPMKKALEKIRDHPFADAVIVSDASTFFIDTILEKANLTSAITAVYSNTAYFDQDGCLIRTDYHSHSCQLCCRTPNMCKGQIVTGIMSQNVHYSKVVYIGDGFNDYCAAMHLSSRDHVIARKGYSLAKRISKEAPPLSKVDIVDFTDDEMESLLVNFLPPLQEQNY